MDPVIFSLTDRLDPYKGIVIDGTPVYRPGSGGVGIVYGSGREAGGDDETGGNPL